MGVQTSIIIPVYNAEYTIERCVESLVFGKVKDIEIILIDDCSIDKSWSKCKEMEKRYECVKSIQNTQNRGVSYTRNRGLELAKGKYVVFIDSDDWVSENYISHLMNEAEKKEDVLVMCGYYYVDYRQPEKNIYLYDEQRNIIEAKDFFKLNKYVLLYQLWNKIFKREIIEKNHIRFDENQSMGEDFQFVLDYMEAMQCKQCVILNEALYYYVRANNSSLMSQFGLIENGNEYKRLEKLLKISGENVPEVQEQYAKAIANTKMSYVYFIARAKNKTLNEKLSMIENVMRDGRAKEYYRQQSIVKMKENIVLSIGKVRTTIERAKGRIRREKRNRLVKKLRPLLKNKEVSLISQNCIAGVFYNDMQMQFLSPTINLYFDCPDFVKFVLNLRFYMEQELRMEWNETYPVGVLEDVRIHFMHYQTCTEAKEAWERRSKRINWENILILSTDMMNFSEEVFEKWKKIQYPKLLFSAKKRDDESCIWYPEYEENGKVIDLIPRREFYKHNILMKLVNKMVSS